LLPSSRIPSWLEPAQLAYKNNVVAIAFSPKFEIALAEIEIVLGEIEIVLGDIEIVLAKFQIVLISNFPLKRRKAPVPDPPGPPGPAPGPVRFLYDAAPGSPGHPGSSTSTHKLSWTPGSSPPHLPTHAPSHAPPPPLMDLWTLMDLLPLLHLQTPGPAPAPLKRLKAKSAQHQDAKQHVPWMTLNERSYGAIAWDKSYMGHMGHGP
jgi:hypothetical protein